MHCFSRALNVEVAVNVIIPDKPKSEKKSGPRFESYKTLYLLHGLSDDHTIWMRRTSIERYAIEHGIAVVMPAGNRSWYSDTAYGAKYFTFVAEELPEICRSYFKGMSDKREDNMVAGLSMGGGHSMNISRLYPKTFDYVALFSAASRGFENADVQATLKTQRDNGFKLYWIACGTDDFLYKLNRDYMAYLDSISFPYTWRESDGGHTWRNWRIYLSMFAQRLF